MGADAIEWEYHTIYANGGLIMPVELNELGAEGWEMCGCVSTVEGPSDLSSNWPAVARFYFKRRKK